jgi:hypothetical protein
MMFDLLDDMKNAGGSAPKPEPTAQQVETTFGPVKFNPDQQAQPPSIDDNPTQIDIPVAEYRRQMAAAKAETQQIKPLQEPAPARVDGARFQTLNVTPADMPKGPDAAGEKTEKIDIYQEPKFKLSEYLKLLATHQHLILMQMI